MNASNNPALTFAKNKDGVPLDVARHERKAKRQQRLDKAYELVNTRDGNKCRCTGNALDPASPDAKHRREHHHIVERSLSKAKREDAKNICLVSAFVHSLITKGWIEVEGEDANLALRFHWTPLATSRQIRIKSKRRSQQ